MGKKQKKLIRQKFRDAVFKRDNYQCVTCKVKNIELDAHHITDRNELPNGGYVPENGISLCPNCHVLAEVFHNTSTAAPGYEPENLYILIGSSYDKALRASEKLKVD